MTRTLAAAALALSCAGHALAAIIHTNVSPGDVYTNTMMLDWYDGLEERYDAAGVEWEDLTQAYKVYAGETTATEVVTNDLGDVLYTNEAPYSVYASSVRTNRDCFLPWVTTHTNAGTVTVTNVPLVTASIVSELDDRTMDITDEYIQLGLTNSAGDYSEWFGTFVTNDGGDRFYPPSVPDACPASVMIAAEIGFTTNLLTNIWGAVTDGEAYFTRHPLTTQDWALAEAYYTCVDGTNGWYFRSLETFDKRAFRSCRHYLETCLEIAGRYDDVFAARRELYEHCLFYHMIDPLEVWGLSLAMFKVAGGDVRKAAIGGTNIGRDSDTIAGRAAMLAGTLRGAENVPGEWIALFGAEALARIDRNADALTGLITDGRLPFLRRRVELAGS